MNVSVNRLTCFWQRQHFDLTIYDWIHEYIQSGLCKTYESTCDIVGGGIKLPVRSTEVFNISNKDMARKDHDVIRWWHSASWSKRSWKSSWWQGKRGVPNHQGIESPWCYARSVVSGACKNPDSGRSKFEFHVSSSGVERGQPAPDKLWDSVHRKGGLSKSWNSEGTKIVKPKRDKQLTGSELGHTTDIVYAKKRKRQGRR